MVPGTGLEPASLLRRRIFITLLLSKPMLHAQPVRALDYAFAIFPAPRAMRAAPDLRRPPSSLYTFLGIACAIDPRLGSALPRCIAHQGFHRI